MAPWAWAIVIAAFLIIEFVSVQLVSIWLAGGSLAGLVLSLIPGVNFWWQLLASVILALILIIATRPFVRKWLSSREVKGNVESLIGRETQLLEAINGSLQNGIVKINGIRFTALSDKPIESGTAVRVVKIEGNKLFVEKI